MSGDDPSTNAATDRDRLVGSAYATPAPLLARVALYAYQRDPLPWPGWVLDHLEAHRPLDATTRVIDVGCGPGTYLTSLRERHRGITAIGFDLSEGMARTALATGAPTTVADAMQLPVRDTAFDVAVCSHMLYHVPDIARAAAELARVVGHDGTVVIVTNGNEHLRAIETVATEAVIAITGTEWVASPRSTARFLLDDAAGLIAPALEIAARHRVQREIVVTEPSPITAYVESQGSFYEPALPAGVRWADVVTEVGTRVQETIDRNGAFVAHSDVGVLLCRAAPD